MDYNQINRTAGFQSGAPQQYNDHNQGMSATGTMHAQMHAQNQAQAQATQPQRQPHQPYIAQANLSSAMNASLTAQQLYAAQRHQLSPKLITTPEFLADFSCLSVPALCNMAKEILVEIAIKTHTIFAVSKNDRYIATDVDQYGEYISKLFFQLAYIRCLLDEKITGNEVKLKDIFDQMLDMSDPEKVEKPAELIELEKKFAENRKKLSDIACDLKLLDWTAAVSDPSQLKRVDKLQNNLKD